ncbi:HNH endonuclease [Clostridium sp. SHJSY1]|uniref:HNH endonuclease n=1 Tax=Clostridium sp. SHJSY1 TaxID=2942483 RepID=UPI002874F822|nr:HNH endonuclease signature motif containing protein [Clostridium sp. SHJSY1]MDS0528264.1 HNH endonuclease [Clostridium sp. SHJSY1]
MFFCEICNKKADIHHIIHRSEGGLDIEINYKYLCEKHHRGKDGPHHSLETDIKYKIELQNKLYNLLPKEYYNSKELGKILDLSVNSLKKITKNIKLYKEGYKTTDIILKLMGNKLYSKETLENLEIQRILENIY